MNGPSQPALGIPCQSQQLEHIIGLLQLDDEGRLAHPDVARLGAKSTKGRLGHWWSTASKCGRESDVPTWERIQQALEDHFARESVPWPSVDDAFEAGFEPAAKTHLTAESIAALTAAIAMGQASGLLPSEIVTLWHFLMAKIDEGAQIPDELT